MTVLPFILAAAQLLAPGRDHSVLGSAIARKVDASDSVFATKLETAAVLLAIAFRESSLTADAQGDKDAAGVTHSFCAFQIHDSSGGSAALLTDVDACVSKGFAMLMTSRRTCGAHPIAWYAEGPRGCTSPRGQRISRDRMALAARLLREVTP